MNPFKILDIVEKGKLVYKLELSECIHQIYPVFHVLLLKSYHENCWEGQVQPPLLPDEIEGELKYEVREVLNSKIV